MELNGKFFKGARNVRAIVGGVILALVGILFIVLGFVVPGNTEGNNKVIGIIVFEALGAIAVVVGILFIVRAVISMKKSKPLSEEEVKANEEKLSIGEPKSENLKDTKLFFHFGGKMNQSYFAEDRNGQHLYECLLVKFNPFAANTYDFINNQNGFKKTMKIGKNVTTGSDGGAMFIGSDFTSRFKIDGVMCWDYLRDRGYEIKHLLSGPTLIRYELHKFGKLVANIVPTNVKDPFNADNVNPLRMGKGVYRIEIIDCKLDDAVMAAFIISQTEMVE